KETSFMEKVLKAATQKVRKTNSLVSVEGMDDVLVHYAKCCHPIPGDGIMGFISRGRGVSIHRSDCQRAFEIDQARKVDVSWTGKEAPTLGDRQVKIRVVAQDEQGLLKKLGEAFSAQGMNIESANIRTNRDRKAICLFDVSVRNTEQVVRAVYELQKIRGIISVERL
nr:ACT domain-containing protein [Pseudobdellovibrionaceae bacterium]